MGCTQSKVTEYASSEEVQALQKQIKELHEQVERTKIKAETISAPQPPVTPPKTPTKQQIYKPITPSEVPLKFSGAEVIFFPDAKLPCYNYQKHGSCRRQNCNFAHEPTNLTRYLDLLNTATKTLDVCVFTITCDEISNAIINLKESGVRVRVITDANQEHSQGSDIGKLRNAQIEVRQNSVVGGALMHHKFVVIDNHMLMAGSFNMTRQAVLANCEDVFILENPVVVTTFAMEFERLWTTFKDNKPLPPGSGGGKGGPKF